MINAVAVYLFTKTMSKTIIYILLPAILAGSCNNPASNTAVTKASDTIADKLQPVLITDSVTYDTDDPAIWINTADTDQSLIIGTDKDTNGGLYIFDLSGRIKNKVPLQRPNNVDVAYGLIVSGKPTDIAVATEREKNTIRIFSLPDLKAIDNGGIAVFENETERAPMGIALYTATDKTIYAIVGRKSGPADGYLWQYRLEDNGNGGVKASLVRKFGKYSGKKEIEAIAVDNEEGYIYYSDEQAGVHQYYADPSKGNEELALFATNGFTSDHEGISIYKTGKHTGYILVSNQQKNTFMVYSREGNADKPYEHRFITEIPVSTDESDGSEVTNTPLGDRFPEGIFIAMSNGRVFHIYDWRQLKERIENVK